MKERIIRKNSSISFPVLENDVVCISINSSYSSREIIVLALKTGSRLNNSAYFMINRSYCLQSSYLDWESGSRSRLNLPGAVHLCPDD